MEGTERTSRRRRIYSIDVHFLLGSIARGLHYVWLRHCSGSGEKAQDYNWFVRFVLKLVALSLKDFSGAAPSLWIWFYAIAETPEAALASRESLIGELHRALIDERFTSFFEEERDDGERTYP